MSRAVLAKLCTNNNVLRNPANSGLRFWRTSVPIRRSLCSITYSGGQASSGQGGFYGSGGARSSVSAATFRPEAKAKAGDIATVINIMSDVRTMEGELRALGNTVSSRSIELKAFLNKKVSNKQVLSLLERLEMKGEPIWGLSSTERDLVKQLRELYNNGF